MKNPFFVNRILMLIIFAGSWFLSKAQSPQTPQQSAIHHWHDVNPAIKLTSSTEGEYKNLPQADYTPQKNIAEWSAAKDLQSFANSFSSKKLSVLYIMTVDETGYIRKLKVIKTSDKTNSDALSAILLNTKVSGPSYLHNQAVSSYVPCSISIEKNQITIL